MNKTKLFLKGSAYFYIILLAYLILATTLNYFNIVSYKALSIVSFVFMILLFMFIGFLVATKSEKRGYISGLIIGSINIILFLFLTILLGDSPKITIGIYFLILLLSSTIGGMFGINVQNKTRF